MSLGYSGLIMIATRYLLLLSLLLAAPAVAQVRAPHHSACESCRTDALPATNATDDEKAAPAAPARSEPASSGSNGCTQCDHPHRMPPRWHSFLPGMYR